MTVAVGVGIVADLPGLLTGALAVEITRELGFGAAGLGAAIAMTRGTAMFASIPVGLLADRIGAIAALRLAALTAGLAATGIAVLARAWIILALCLGVAGVAIAIGQPAANRLLSKTVPSSRQGIAFGVKQAAPPTASLLAGVSVPALALTVGWRWAFAAAAMAAVAMVPAIGRRPSGPRPPVALPLSHRSWRQWRRPRGHMLWLGSGFALGSAAAIVVPAFYVDAAVTAGTSPSTAGLVLATAGAATVAVRVTMGIVADRRERGHIRMCAALLAVGTGGLVLLSTGQPVLQAAGAVVGTAALWGFNGVFWFSVVRLAGQQPGTITGLMSPAGHLGGSLGPLAFGSVAAQAGYGATWLAWTAFGVGGTVSMLLASRALGQSMEVRP